MEYSATSLSLYQYLSGQPNTQVDPYGLANLWNSLTWGIDSPSQGWLEFINPLSEESLNSLAGAGMALGTGTVNLAAGAYMLGHDIATLPIDLATTAYGVYDPNSQWQSSSYYGSSTTEALRSGASVQGIQLGVAANAASFGVYGLGTSAYNYYETGDPTQFQQYTGSFAAGTFFAGYARGGEFSFGPNGRFAPFGNRTGHATGRFPHYHRRAMNPNCPGETLPGGGIGRHRPWDVKSTDTSFWDRF